MLMAEYERHLLGCCENHFASFLQKYVINVVLYVICSFIATSKTIIIAAENVCERIKQNVCFTTISR